MQNKRIYLTEKHVVIVVVLALAIITATFLFNAKGCESYDPSEVSGIESLSVEAFQESLYVAKFADQIEKKQPRSANAPELPNMFFLTQGNQYDSHYSGEEPNGIWFLDSTAFGIACYLGNNGRACWIPRQYQLYNLFEILTLKVGTEEFYETYKSYFRPTGATCFEYPTAPCVPCDSIGLGVMQRERYDNEGGINGEGKYAAMFCFDEAGLVPQISRRDDVYFLGLDVYRRADGYLDIRIDNSILTRKLKLKLAHHK